MVSGSALRKHKGVVFGSIKQDRWLQTAFKCPHTGVETFITSLRMMQVLQRRQSMTYCRQSMTYCRQSMTYCRQSMTYCRQCGPHPVITCILTERPSQLCPRRADLFNITSNTSVVPSARQFSLPLIAPRKVPHALDSQCGASSCCLLR